MEKMQQAKTEPAKYDPLSELQQLQKKARYTEQALRLQRDQNADAHAGAIMQILDLQDQMATKDAKILHLTNQVNEMTAALQEKTK